MSEVSGSALLAGNPSPDPAPAPAAPAPAPTDWTESFKGDEALAGVVAKKGWSSPADAIKAYSELERYMGGEKVPVPKGPEDKAAWDLLWKAAGRPESPAGYELGDGSEQVAAKAHELGLTPAQVRGMMEFQGETAKAAEEARMQALGQQHQADVADLRKEWGGNYDALVEAGRRGRDLAGVDEETFDILANSIGLGKAAKMFAEIGSKLAEAPARGMGNGTSGALTPESARAELARLKADPGFSKRAYDGDAAARETISRLNRIIAGVSA